MTIKVCHMTSAHDSDDVRIFQKECVSIAKDPRFEVYLVAPGDSRLDKKVHVIGVGEKPSSRVKRMLSFTNKVYEKALEIDADIYHFHDPELLSSGLKLKKKGKKVFFDSHEYTYQQIKIKGYIPSFLRGLVGGLYLKNETKICKQLDGVIFPCKIDGKNPFLNRCKQTIYINNLPYLEEFLDMGFRNSHSKDNMAEINKIYDICHIGSLSEERGIRELLTACNKINATVLLGGDFASEEFQNSLTRDGLMENVEFVGYCDRYQVVDYYKKSKIGASTILPVGQYPIAGNLPTKVYEFMAMGIPVVISNFSHTLEVLEEYRFGIAVNPYDINAIENAINKLLNDDELRSKMGQNGRKAIEEVFNWEEEAKKIIDAYIGIMNQEGDIS